jgi:uncharacterized protein YndB with AHSA1/START domain
MAIMICKRFILLGVCGLLVGCTTLDPHYQREMALQNQTVPRAPVSVHQDVVIDAPIDLVWQVLSDMPHWPDWNPSISSVVLLDGIVAPGNRFNWEFNEQSIQSEIATVEAPHTISWTGKALGSSAVHVWELSTWRDGATLVKSNESINGMFIELFFDNDELRVLLEEWLGHLKAESERRAQIVKRANRDTTPF